MLANKLFAAALLIGLASHLAYDWLNDRVYFYRHMALTLGAVLLVLVVMAGKAVVEKLWIRALVSAKRKRKAH